MSRLSLIIQREYFQAVLKKSFLVTTLLVPILSVLICGVLPAFLANVKSNEQKNVAVIDRSSQNLGTLLEDSEEYHFINADAPLADDDIHSYYSNGEGLYALVVIPDSVIEYPKVYIYSDVSVAGSLEHDLSSALRPVLRRQRVESYGIDSLEEIIRHCDVSLDVKNIKWNEDGSESVSSAQLGEIIGLLLALLTYMFVLMYGAMIMNGVIEEKTNRIVEVIVSSCKPIELLLGKVIGVALVGITQLVIWGVLMGIGGLVASVFFGISAAPGAAELAEAQAQIDALQEQGFIAEALEMLKSLNLFEIGLCFLLYFIGGYLLYASLFAAFGSAVDQANDASQFMAPIMIIMVFALYAGMFSIENPDGPLAWWCSMIPFTSPIVMMIRLPFDVPFYELLLSFFLLYATSFLILWLSARIYRTGILMYGKKFTLKEILRWIK